MSPRHHRPLHACGVSIFAIVDVAIGKSQHINGPIGSTLRKVANLATPFIYAMQIQWLTILSFIDDAILAIEKITEKLFPPSTRLFDKLDEIVLMIVFFPEKFYGTVNKFPTMIHQVPFLDWSLTLMISRLNSLFFALNSLFSTLNRLGHEFSRVIQKTIGADRSSNEGYLLVGSSADINRQNLENIPPIISECGQKGIHDIAESTRVKVSYKEALARGKEETPHEKLEKECIEKKVVEN